MRGRLLERLQVGVDREELDALDLGLDHPVDRVDAGAADADDAQHRRRRPARRGAKDSADRARGGHTGQPRRAAGRSGSGRGPAGSRGCRPRRRGAGAPAARGRDALARPAPRGGRRGRRCRRLGGRGGGRGRGRLSRLAPGLGGALPPRASGRRCPRRRSCGTGPPAAPRACSRAYRLAFAEDLLRELPVGVGGHPVRIVLQHRHALHRRLGEPHRLADPRGEHAVAEVLLEQLDRLLGVERARVDQRRQDPLDVDVRVEVLPDHRERVLKLDQAAHRQILALDGDDHLVGGRQRVDRQQPEARRRVDEHEVVVLVDLGRAPSAASARGRSSSTSRSRRRRGRSTRRRRRPRACGSPRGSRCGARARRTSTSRACPGRCPATSSGCPAGPCRSTGRGGPPRRRPRRD